MRLFEAIIDANHRAVAGDATAGLHPGEYTGSLPVVALTCIDPRLNAFFPNALALPAEDFIWLRNAGNVITGTLSSTMRSLALACAVKGGREIAVIGHSDCLVCKTTTMQLLDRLKALGVDRKQLPENLNEFFGMFGSERQNVIKACDFIRSSPLIGPAIPVHGLLLNIENGSLEWIVNGYETLQAKVTATMPSSIGGSAGSLGVFKDFAMGEMKFPETQIGAAAARIGNELQAEVGQGGSKGAQPADPLTAVGGTIAEKVSDFAAKNWPQTPPIPIPMKPPALPGKKAPLPPPIRPGANFRGK